MRMLMLRALRAPDTEGAGAGGSSPGGASAPAPAAPSAPAGGGSPAGTSPSPSPPGESAAQRSRADIVREESLREAEAIFRYDPFTDDGQGTEPPSQTADPAAGQGGGSPGQQPGAPTPAAAPDPSQAGLDLLTRLAAGTEAAAAAAAEAARTARAPAAPPTPADPYADIPHVPLTVPPQLFAALNSENPQERHAALGTTMSLVHRAAMGNTVRFMREELARVIPAIIQHHISRHAEEQAVHQDFYGAYPEFNRAELHPVVQRTAEQLLRSGKYTGYSAEFREAVGNAVRAQLQAALGLTPEQLQAALGTRSAEAARAPVLTPPGGGAAAARPGMNGRDRSIADMLGM